MRKYQHILVATDLNGKSEAIIEKAKFLSQLFAAHLSLIHTIEPTPAYGFPGSTLKSPIIEDAKRQMRKLGEKLEIPEDHQLIEFGSVKKEVIKAAEKIHADLIIVGSHGRHGLAKLLLDSSANKISHDAKCDVLTVSCIKKGDS